MGRMLAALIAVSLAAVACSRDDGAGQLDGGWTPVSRDVEGVQAAEAVALDAIYTEHPTRALVDEVTAETQVVAGMNYRFHVEMTGSPEFRKIFEVVVYEDLDGNLEVTSLEQLQGD